ncbi:hypothetical protein CR159_02240 [Pollutimonas subterranea]|uniref:Uncharacterized protein n=1 Tax=Pollutimonas subterranea TaxID=2045210 RepID=A0A2N4UA09_9BURK|nr:hypothetical protein [Pollutimonas subterranea]PLC51855.1 hypothetical protein CR159_02240 [Pollutimonas subterranea]
MNISNFEHVLYALLIQAAVWLLTRNWGLGAMLVIGVFIGREHAQREYNVDGSSKLTPWEAFNVWDWSVDAQLDLALPVVAVVLVALVASYRSR